MRIDLKDQQSRLYKLREDDLAQQKNIYEDNINKILEEHKQKEEEQEATINLLQSNNEKLQLDIESLNDKYNNDVADYDKK